MDSTISESVNDNINMDSTISGSMNTCSWMKEFVVHTYGPFSELICQSYVFVLTLYCLISCNVCSQCIRQCLYIILIMYLLVKLIFVILQFCILRFSKFEYNTQVRVDMMPFGGCLQSMPIFWNIIFKVCQQTLYYRCLYNN